MFRKKETKPTPIAPAVPIERVTTVLGSGTTYKGSLSGSGGVRIEGAFEGEITMNGMLVIGATGRVTCPHIQANVVIVAGALRGDITAEKVEIRSSGRVWGNVKTAAFSTEEGAFLRGEIQMEEKVEIQSIPPEKTAAEAEQSPQQAQAEAEKLAPTSETEALAKDQMASAELDSTPMPQPMPENMDEQQGMDETQPPESTA